MGMKVPGLLFLQLASGQRQRHGRARARQLRRQQQEQQRSSGDSAWWTSRAVEGAEAGGDFSAPVAPRSVPLPLAMRPGVPVPAAASATAFSRGGAWSHLPRFAADGMAAGAEDAAAAPPAWMGLESPPASAAADPPAGLTDQLYPPVALADYAAAVLAGGGGGARPLHAGARFADDAADQPPKSSSLSPTASASSSPSPKASTSPRPAPTPFDPLSEVRRPTASPASAPTPGTKKRKWGKNGRGGASRVAANQTQGDAKSQQKRGKGAAAAAAAAGSGSGSKAARRAAAAAGTRKDRGRRRSSWPRCDDVISRISNGTALWNGTTGLNGTAAWNGTQGRAEALAWPGGQRSSRGGGNGSNASNASSYGAWLNCSSDEDIAAGNATDGSSNSTSSSRGGCAGGVLGRGWGVVLCSGPLPLPAPSASPAPLPSPAPVAEPPSGPCGPKQLFVLTAGADILARPELLPPLPSTSSGAPVALQLMPSGGSGDDPASRNATLARLQAIACYYINVRRGEWEGQGHGGGEAQPHQWR